MFSALLFVCFTFGVCRLTYREYREGDDRSAYETGAMLDYSTAVPSVNDPKLWMVQCKAGEETRILTALMNKYISKAMADSPLGIFSVVCPASG